MTTIPFTVTAGGYFDAEELTLMESCVDNIKKHIDRNLKIVQDKEMLQKLKSAQFYLVQNF